MDQAQYALMCRRIIEAGWTVAKKYKDQKRAAERMIADAREEWKELKRGDIETERDIKIAQLQQHIRNLKQEFKGTPSGTMAIMRVEKSIIELKGLNPAKKVELTGANGNPIQTEGTQVILYLPDNGRDEKNN